MDYTTGRPDSITDYLITLHIGPWFNYNGKEEVYANLRVEAGYEKPTENDCSITLAKMQSEHDAKAYTRNRLAEYPSVGDQLDDLYHLGVFSTEMTAQLKAIKDKYPKE